MITLKTLDEANPQDVFNQVATHLLTQNAPSIRGLGCAYRGEGGMKCAAGCLIADEEYDVGMEMLTWEGLSDQDGFPKGHQRLIQALQNVHDSHRVSEWREQLQKIAGQFELTTEVLDDHAGNTLYGN